VNLFDLLEQYEDLEVPADAPVIAIVRKAGRKAGGIVRVEGDRRFTAKGARSLAECVSWAAEHMECSANVPAVVDAEYAEYAHVNGQWWPVRGGMVLARRVS
jgi:hypothetical protein